MTHQQQCLAFFATRASLILSTYDVNGRLETSVAPFVSDGAGYLYLFISELAQHTQNILQLIKVNKTNTQNPHDLKPPGLVSCLLVADESQTEQLFARERLTMQLSFAEVHRNSPNFETIMHHFSEKFGEIIYLLQSLPDFHLIQLTPVSGGYVKGFGQAFTFDGCPCQGLHPVKTG